MRISVHDIVKRFGANEVVGRSSFSIADGELFTLLGPSGCGKTTLLRLIAGFYAPDAGEVRFDERRVNEVPPHERGIGMVFQNYALWPHMTVFDNVAYGLKLRGIARAEIADRVRGVLEKVRLPGLGERYPGQLSGGQQQRVALARALVLSPKILLLDEPLSNLDAKVRIQVRAEIRKLQKELGITTVYVTHDQEEALTLSDRIVVFNQARVFQVGTPRELYEQPANRFVADFIGINNLIDGTVRAVEPGFLRVETALGEMRALPNSEVPAGAECIVCVRPENIALDGAGGERNVVQGKIGFSAYLGNTMRYDVELAPGITLKVDDRDPWHHAQRPLGAAAELSFAWRATLAIPRK
ncbi:MAG TPA: ABC transporter ATP-binding protein [Burkholderiales bacterium]|nr:ABC transporter ATP-binding protein [Burkholderiales bacterium]